MTAPDVENAYEQADQHRLRLVECPVCEVKDRQMQSIGIDLENLEADVKAKNRLIGRLKSDLVNERRDSPFHADAQAIYEYWRKTCRPGARAFGEDRLKAVLGRLNEKKDKVPGVKRREAAYSPRFICEAVKGSSIDPSRDSHGVPWNDLELICRDSKHLETFHDAYKAWRWPEAAYEARSGLYDAWVEART
mgnify:CR=1 FL=1